MPEQATENSAEGAAAFLDHYLDVMNYASHTGDVDPLRALSLDDCTGCQKYVDHYREVYETGGWYCDGGWSVSQVELQPLGNETLLITTVTLAAGSHKENGAAGTQSFSETAEDVSFAAAFTDDGWVMTQMAPGRQA